MAKIVGYSRLQNHTLTTSGLTFSIPPSEDFTDGTWDTNGSQLMLSEFGINEADKTVFVRIDNEIVQLNTGASLWTPDTIAGTYMTSTFSGIKGVPNFYLSTYTSSVSTAYENEIRMDSSGLYLDSVLTIQSYGVNSVYLQSDELISIISAKDVILRADDTGIMSIDSIGTGRVHISSTYEGDIDIDTTFIGNINIKTFGTGNIDIDSVGNLSLHSPIDVYIQSDDVLTLDAGNILNIDATNTINLDSSDSIIITSTNNTTIQSDNIIVKPTTFDSKFNIGGSYIYSGTVSSTDNGVTYMRNIINTTDDTPTVIATIPMNDKDLILIELKVTCSDPTFTYTGFVEGSGGFSKIGGTVSGNDNFTGIFNSTGFTAFDVVIQANGSNTGADIIVTGEAAVDVSWHINYNYTKQSIT